MDTVIWSVENSAPNYQLLISVIDIRCLWERDGLILAARGFSACETHWPAVCMWFSIKCYKSLPSFDRGRHDVRKQLPEECVITVTVQTCYYRTFQV